MSDDINLSLEYVEKLLDIVDLKLGIANDREAKLILKDISFNICVGDRVGVIGRSGSGKSMLAKAILGLNNQIRKYSQTGQIVWMGGQAPIDLAQIEDDSLQKVRQAEIGLVFQQSAQVFNPTQTIGKQLLEKLVVKENSKATILAGLEEVELNPSERFFNAYPHNLSGGQLQRALLALSLINEPRLLIADEPLSALDSTTQNQILKLLKKIVDGRGAALLIISHDLGQVFDLCDRVIVLENHTISEQGMISQILQDPQTKLTKAYQASLGTTPAKVMTSETKDVLISIKNVTKVYRKKNSFLKAKSELDSVLDNYNLDIYRGEILGLYGKSGSGKSTLARMILILESYDSGLISYAGTNLQSISKHDLKAFRSKAQIIFQDPFSSMSPHRTVKQHFEDVCYASGKRMNENDVLTALKRVGMVAEHLHRIPKQLSGGERQRVLIARALYMQIEFLICDEIFASLDVLAAESIEALLRDLVKEKGLTILFISHDMKVINQFCDRKASLDR